MVRGTVTARPEEWESNTIHLLARLNLTLSNILVLRHIILALRPVKPLETDRLKHREGD